MSLLNKNLYRLGPLYHDFSIFGVKNFQLEGIYSLNQKCKEPIIRAYIAYAIAKCLETEKNIKFVELFCADGYYAFLASLFGASDVFGIDDNKDNYSLKSEKIAKKLHIPNYTFIKENINNIQKYGPYEIVANVGGLYHVSNPKEILLKSYNIATRFLIIQSVVSLANCEKDYFETPAPGWTWGSRFNQISFEEMIKSCDFTVIDKHFNELLGNPRAEDRGSVYYLIEKKKSIPK